MEQQQITSLVERQGEKMSMDQAFYTDAGIYRSEMEKIFMRSWLYAGHISEIPRVGDWFLYELDNESVIIIRAGENKVNALVNVCRHRGSRLCLEHQGHSRRITCLYHGWTYDMEGQLRAAAHMGEEFDKTEVKLRTIHCELVAGMIYINFAEDPASLEPAQRELEDVLKHYDLANAKVAHRQSYPMDANWKLAVENYCECYHCAPSHPEYSRGHSLADPDHKTVDLYEPMLENAQQCGLSERQFSKLFLDSDGFGADYNYVRYPMVRGHKTGSDDGQPVAPLMGEITDYYGGCTDFQVGPVTFALAYCDYIVIYAFKPLSQNRADCDITWIVRGDAEEGKDYDHDRLIWLWDVTTHADKRIIERNAQGVGSRFYKPGPLSIMEDFTWQFLSWYQDTMKRA